MSLLQYRHEVMRSAASENESGMSSSARAGTYASYRRTELDDKVLIVALILVAETLTDRFYLYQRNR